MNKELKELLSDAFITAESGAENSYFIKIEFNSIHKMHEAHRTLVKWLDRSRREQEANK